MDNKGRILVIDDEPGIRQGCVRVLQPQGYTVETASSFQDGLSKIKADHFDMVLLDLMLPDGKGVNLLSPIRERDPETVPVVITGYATIELAVETIKRGAYNFISKPFTADVLLMTVSQGMEKRHLSLEAKRLHSVEKEAEELTRARDEAQRLNEFKSSFLLMVTHELRSPVSGAQSLVRTMLHGLAGALNPQQTELLSRVEVRLNFLLELINDLLALAASKSLEAGKSLEPVRVQPLLHRIVDTYTDDAKNKKVEMKCSMIDKALRVQAIEKDLDTVLRNLINNAIKYTPQGGSVHVDVTKDNDHARISVKDTGIGISEEDLLHIGEEFFRAKNATTEGIPGTGLGISIVKQLVERMGGQMNVTSSLGNGSTFTVLLRLAH